MFVEGACLCNGALCDDVEFTFNMQFPPNMNESEYWRAWQETVWFDLDQYAGSDYRGKVPKFSVNAGGTLLDDFTPVNIKPKSLFENAPEPGQLLDFVSKEPVPGYCDYLNHETSFDFKQETSPDFAESKWKQVGQECHRDFTLRVRRVETAKSDSLREQRWKQVSQNNASIGPETWQADTKIFFFDNTLLELVVRR